MPQTLRARLGTIIFEAETPLGKLFDVVLLWSIVLSILLMMLESVPSIRASYGAALRGLEWVFTGLFTLEYVARVYAARKRVRYVTSFYGLVDLLAVAPGYLSLLFTGSQYLLVIRALRLLRIFRVLKLSRYLGEASLLVRALHASRVKITVFLYAVLTVVVIIGAVMHLIEGPDNGFTSIPISVYWAIVTLTTVGYGDIAPQTPLGQMISSVVMIMGYGIIAVPTGIVTAELSRAARSKAAEHEEAACTNCGRTGHDVDALHCKYCGAHLFP